VRALSDQEVLRVWESGLDEHPIDRALTVLAAVLPDAGRSELAAMSVGRRDGHLMAVREANFGSRVSGVAECPQCGELLQWDLDLGDVRSARNDHEEGTNRVVIEGHELLYRLPDSTDLAAVALGGDVATARRGALDLARRISFEGCYHRTDIAADDEATAALLRTTAESVSP